ncbi:Cilia- and flagella-associated protein 47 [Borealophlyctis nickersoniae]|nr:Cilia- and flagella-associated protein 47 [Borealophlyctis nickersoniae]
MRVKRPPPPRPADKAVEATTPPTKSVDILAIDKQAGTLLHGSSVDHIENTGVPRSAHLSNTTFRFSNKKQNISGSRPTLFTDLATLSTRSTRAAQIRANASIYAGMRIAPQVVEIRNYTPQTRSSVTIHVANFSDRAKRIAVLPPRGKVFRLAKGSEVDGMFIAPGMEATIIVEFLAPSPEFAGKGGRNSRPSTSHAEDPCTKIWRDVLGIEVEGDKKVEVPLEAHPAGPKLQTETEVDFGTLVVRKDEVKAATRKDTDGWVSKQLEIRNVGGRSGKFSCSWDTALNVRVHPSSGVLACANTATDGQSNSWVLDISFFPGEVGIFREVIHIDLQPDGNNAHDANGGSFTSTADVAIKAEVIDHKLRLCTADGSRALDLSNLDFGTVHYSRTAGLPAKLENRSPSSIKWVITHAGESRPMVPPKLRNDTGSVETLALSNQHDVDTRASVSVFPTEGSLEPYRSTPITFTFAPRMEPPPKGFKSNLPPPPPRTYSVPMHLKIVSSSSHTVGEEAILVTLTGKACAVMASLSRTDVRFPDTPSGMWRHVFVEVKNLGEELGFKFSFDSAAHFKAEPRRGIALPGEAKRVKMLFKPNQLGELKTTMNCVISAMSHQALNESQGANENDLLQNVGAIMEGDQVVERIPVHLSGTCVPPSYGQTGSYARLLSGEPRSDVVERGAENARELPVGIKTLHEKVDHHQGSRKSEENQHLSNESVYIEGGKNANPEWNKKSEHRKKYAAWLAQSRLRKLRKKRNAILGDDGVHFHLEQGAPYLFRENGACRIDKQTGLVEPEPIECLLFGDEVADVELGVLRKSTKTGNKSIAPSSTARNTDTRKLRVLFEKLAEPVVQRARYGNLAPGVSPAADSAGGLLAPPSTAAAGGFDEPLSGTDLANIFASTAALNFGYVTVHSRKVLPLNFLNAAPANKAIHVSIVSEKHHVLSDGLEDQLTISPTHQVIPPFTVLGCEIVFKSDKPGTYERKVTYLVNGRYRYQIPIKVVVVPVELSLDVNDLEIDVPIATGKKTEESNGDVKNDRVDRGSEDATKGGAPMGSKTVHLINNGNYPASFRWTLPEPTSGANADALHTEGHFTVQPMKGTVPSQITMPVCITYTPGVKPVQESFLKVEVIDDTDGRVVKTLSLECKGITLPTTCALLTSLKQGPIDMGIVALGFENPPADTTRQSVVGRPQTEFQTPSTQTYNMLATANLFPSAPTAKLSGPRPGSRVIRLKNTSPNPCMYIAHCASGSHCVKIAPQLRIIAPGTVQDVNISVLPIEPGTFDDAVLVTVVGGGRVIRVPFRYEGRAPQVSVESRGPDTAMSKGTIIGSFSTRGFQVVNSGSVVARCLVDMRGKKEFEMKCAEVDAKQRHVGSGKSSGRGSANPASAGKAKDDGTMGYAARLARFKVVKPTDELYFSDTPVRQSRGDSNGNVYLFDVLPNETFPLEMVFRPTTTASYSFPLPLVILGVQPSTTISPQIDACGVPSPLSISKMHVAFKNKVVFHDSSTALGVSHLTTVAKDIIVFTNHTDSEMEWWFDLDVLEDSDSVFRVEPWRGTIDPEGAQSVVVSFQPETVGPFESNLPLHVDMLGMRPSFHLKLTGNGVEPSLAFDPPEIFLPIVPLGSETSAIFSVVNYGCERTEIRVTTPEEITGNSHAGKPGLELMFPEGRLLKSDGERLTVVVKFRSGESIGSAGGASGVNGPLSFTTKVEFGLGTSGGRTFYLPVHGTTDANVLTLQPFFWLNKNDWKFNLKNDHVVYERIKPLPILDENQKRTRILTGPRPFTTPCGIPLENGPDHRSINRFYSELLEALGRWLENHIGSYATSGNFVEILASSNGILLQDLIQSMSGKRVPTVAASIAPSSLEESSVSTHKQYGEILTYLTGIGALLGAVKPEFLLLPEDYQRVVEQRFESLKLDLGYCLHDEEFQYQQKVESHFHIFQKEAWCMVLLQVVRVLAGQGVSPRQYRSLQGIGKDEADLQWQLFPKGNVYGVFENVLLKWASYHTWKSTGVIRRLTNFTTDFRDALPFAYILASHVPGFAEEQLPALHEAPDNQEQYLYNASRVLSTLNDLFPGCQGLRMKPTHLTDEAHPIEIVLLLLFLYQVLPGYIPRGTIDFHGVLHEKMTRHIELGNTGGKSVTYLAELEGCSDFQIGREGDPSASGRSMAIQVAPKITTRVPIEFTGRFSRPAEGRLTLRSKKMGINDGAIILYDLVSAVEPSAPRKTFRVEAPMYATPPAVVNMEVTNPFSVKGVFQVVLKQNRKITRLVQVPNPDGGKTVMTTVVESVPYDAYSPAAFRTVHEEVLLDSNQTTVLPVLFLPFDLGSHECILHFSDESVGEFTYHIDGRATVPHPTENLLWTTKSSTALEKGVRITPVNPARDRALYAALQSASVGKMHGGLKSKAKAKSGLEQTLDKDALQLPKRPLKYKVEYSSSYFQGPNEITIKPPVDLPKEKRHLLAYEQNYTELPVVFHPTDTRNYIENLFQNPGKYSCKITLTCMEASDVRVLKVDGMAISEGSKAELEFAVPARQSVTQDIPIVNKSDEDWTIKAHLQGPYFTAPYSVTARARSSVIYPITFRPPRAGESQALLTLSNLQTAQKYVYHLYGVAQDPLPEEAKEIRCNARDKVDVVFPVRNYSDRDAEFDVITDIPYSHGETSVFVPAGQSVDYRLSIHARGSGEFNKLVTFLSKADQTYVWYTVKVIIRPPPAEDTLNLSTTVRHAVGVEIPLSNPLDHAAEFNVEIEGDGLIGDAKIRLEAKEEKTYTLTYAPMLSSRASGSIKFYNEDIGEFWYELQLEASDAPPVRLSDMECPLGKCCLQTISIENPLPQATPVEISLSNARDFQIVHPPVQSLKSVPGRRPPGGGPGSNKSVTLAPMERTKVQLAFWPSSLTETRHCEVVVLSDVIGNSVFTVDGRGLLPEPMEETLATSELSDTVTSAITFTNPLVDPIAVTVTLEDIDNRQHYCNGLSDFALILHRRGGARFHVGGLDKLEIPFTYTPSSMRCAVAKVTVELSPQIKWIFPIRGIPEHPVTTSPYNMECRTRERLEREVELHLPGFVPTKQSDGQVEDGVDWVSQIQCAVEAPPPSPIATVDEERVTVDTIRNINVVINQAWFERDTGLMAKAKITYTPPRPTDQTLLLILTQTSTTCRWRFPLRLISHPPSLDDTIIIEGTIGKVSSVTFDLRNDRSSPREFRAYITTPGGAPGSAGRGGTGLSVLPERGVLVPEGEKKEGDNRFVVRYRPATYGKTVVGLLVIEAEDISWSFEVRGVTPTSYRHPSSAASSATHRQSSIDAPRRPQIVLSQHLRHHHVNRKNFVRDNATNPLVAAAVESVVGV